MEIINKEDVCYGCKIPKIYKNICPIRIKELSEACPCIECIVKVICEEACSKYAKYCRESKIWI